MKRTARTIDELKDAEAFGVAGVRAESHRLAIELQAPALLPPHDRTINHAADALISLITQDAVDDLLVACRDPAVDVAMKALLGALAAATMKRRRAG